MADFDTVEPIDDGEILYRRIPVSTGWYQPDKQPPLEPEAFRPTRSENRKSRQAVEWRFLLAHRL